MIKINKVPCPSELTLQNKAALTQEYKDNGTSVWRKKYIKEGLLLSSHHKCVYCECLLNIESNYLEVEHFHHKDKYPNEVVDWDNLLPSCKRCNATKGQYDTYLNPFVNPATMSPKSHIVLDTFLLRPITLAGENTIEELNLNDLDKLLPTRYALSQVTTKCLENIYQLILNYRDDQSNRKLIKIVSSTKSILNESVETSAYSAIISTFITNSTTFMLIKAFLISVGKWDNELHTKLTDTENNALSTDSALFQNYLLGNFQ
ncbi:HNH endonuclease [Lysinibacillus sp. 2017]|uniref:HNH endonuclease n=1 Tax=unclassified Lysinibacillus TaxID=2636778 RepID=UPI000D529151|nr:MULTISPECIES: HNH endonuclease [unclassified Lysinibacillus]AWE06062.1 HNH endonuclease [Lysinibacillus sp. 2017]TGN31150.1 HNH endonuclease [Lysinibacillus sp. S2017]